MTTTTTTTKQNRALLAGLVDDLLETIARQASADAADDENGIDLAIEDMQEAEATLQGAMRAADVRALSRKGHIIVDTNKGIDGGLPEIMQKFAVVVGPVLALD